METEVKEHMEKGQEDLLELKKNLETLRHDVAALLATLRETAKGQMFQAKNRLWSSARNLEDEAQSRFDHAYEKVKERGEMARGKTLEALEERPVTSVLGAFAAGFLLAALMRRH